MGTIFQYCYQNPACLLLNQVCNVQITPQLTITSENVAALDL